MSIEKSAFDFVEQATFATSVEELDRLFLAHAEPMGVDYALGGVVFARRRVFRPNILLGSRDHAWFRHYNDQNLFRRDVILPRMCSTVSPVSWSAVASERAVTHDELEVLLGPKDFGLSDGLAIPLHCAQGEMGTLTVAGSHFVSDATIEMAVYMMAKKAYHRMIELLDEEPVNPVSPKLSKRQLQCLNLVKEGKTTAEIAEVLEISPHTAKEHIEKVMEIFDVGTRVEAVVAAHRDNLLSF